MGLVRKINSDRVSCEVVVLESGKVLRRYWNDLSMNSILRRTPLE